MNFRRLAVSIAESAGWLTFVRGDIVQTYLRGGKRAPRHGTPLTDSLQMACRDLRPSERLLLLWRYEDGLQLNQIAGLLGTHQSNVVRRLERMQEKLRSQVISVLSKKYGMSGPAIQECMRDGVENPRHTISISDLLRAPSLEQNDPALPVAQGERPAMYWNSEPEPANTGQPLHRELASSLFSTGKYAFGLQEARTADMLRKLADDIDAGHVAWYRVSTSKHAADDESTIRELVIEVRDENKAAGPTAVNLLSSDLRALSH